MPRATTITGYTESDLSGRRVGDLFANEHVTLAHELRQLAWLLRDALPQGGHDDDVRAEAVVEVVAERAARAHLRKAAVGRGDDAPGEAEHVVTPYRRVRPLL